MEIAGWGPNVYVKIPITNTRAEPAYDLAGKLSHAGVRLNVTAIMTLDQVRNILLKISPKTSTLHFRFRGRIADTGRDPLPLMAAAVELLKIVPSAELIWASPRELLNVFHAEAIGCHIITVTNDVLKKMKLVDYDLTEYSLDTVKMFHEDARNAGFTRAAQGPERRKDRNGRSRGSGCTAPERREIVLLGTAHVSRESVEEVRKVIAEEKPDRVCVELDEGRYTSISQGSSWQNLNVGKVIRQGKGFLLMANLVLASFQRRLGKDLGVKPGRGNARRRAGLAGAGHSLFPVRPQHPDHAAARLVPDGRLGKNEDARGPAHQRLQR